MRDRERESFETFIYIYILKINSKFSSTEKERERERERERDCNSSLANRDIQTIFQLQRPKLLPITKILIHWITSSDLPVIANPRYMILNEVMKKKIKYYVYVYSELGNLEQINN